MEWRVLVRGLVTQVDVRIGPKFRTVLVYTPPNSPARGGGLGPNPAPSVPPMRGSWEESVWIRPRGF